MPLPPLPLCSVSVPHLPLAYIIVLCLPYISAVRCALCTSFSRACTIQPFSSVRFMHRTRKIISIICLILYRAVLLCCIFVFVALCQLQSNNYNFNAYVNNSTICFAGHQCISSTLYTYHFYGVWCTTLGPALYVSKSPVTLRCRRPFIYEYVRACDPQTIHIRMVVSKNNSRLGLGLGIRLFAPNQISTDIM